MSPAPDDGTSAVVTLPKDDASRSREDDNTRRRCHIAEKDQVHVTDDPEPTTRQKPL